MYTRLFMKKKKIITGFTSCTCKKLSSKTQTRKVVITFRCPIRKRKWLIPLSQWNHHPHKKVIFPLTQWNQPLTKKVIFPLSLWNYNSTDSVESTTYQKVIFPLSLWNHNSTDSVESTNYKKSDLSTESAAVQCHMKILFAAMCSGAATSNVMYAGFG